MEEGQIFMTSSGLAPSNWKKKKKKEIKGSYVYIEESFDTIFNMGYWAYGSGKSPRVERVNKSLSLGT